MNTTEKSILKDLIKAVQDNVPLSSWLSDIREEPEAYGYDESDLEQFIAKFS